MCIKIGGCKQIYWLIISKNIHVNNITKSDDSLACEYHSIVM